MDQNENILETLAFLVPPTPEGGFQINAAGTNLMEELLEKYEAHTIHNEHPNSEVNTPSGV